MFFKKKKSWVYRASDALRTVEPMDDFFSGGCWDEMMNLLYEIGGYDNQDTRDALNRSTERYKQYLDTSQKMHELLRAETMNKLKGPNEANGYETD